MMKNILVLSAKDKESLIVRAKDLLFELKENSYTDKQVADICYTLQIGRDTMNSRVAFPVGSIKDITDFLQAFLDGSSQVGYTGEGDLGENKEDISGLSEETIARKWAESGNVDFGSLYDNSSRPHIISLPTYSFEKTYTEVIPVFDEAQTILYKETWEKCDALKLSDKKTTGKVLIFAPSEMENDVSRAFLSDYKDIDLQFERKCSNSDSFDYYEKYFKEIAGKKEKIHGIVYCADTKLGDKEKFFDDVAGMIRGIAASGISLSRVLIVSSFETNEERYLSESLTTIPRSVSLILQGVSVSTVCIHNNSEESFSRLIASEFMDGDKECVLYEGDTRSTHGFKQVTVNSTKNAIKQNGVYLITGGMGGIGRIFATWLLKKYDATVILLGRRAEKAVQEKLKELRSIGGTVYYLQADVGNREEVLSAVKKAQSLCGTINGYFHAAGLEGDKKIQDMSLSEFQKIVAPNLSGSHNLIEAAAGSSFDFIFMCSSSSVMLGDFGNMAYGLGNSYEMQLSRYTDSRIKSINWPLWESGGMGQGDDEFTKMYVKSSGQKLLKSETAVEVLEKFLGSDENNILVMIGDRTRIERFLLQNPVEEKKEKSNKQVKASKSKVRSKVSLSSDKVMLELKEATKDVLQLSVEDMGDDENLADFGYDSISLAEFAENVSERLGIKVTPVVFFSHPTLARVRDFLCDTYKDEMSSFDSEDDEDNEALEETENEERIAIIGMSGRFPGAENPDELWQILAQGKESVCSVPQSRASDWRISKKESHLEDKMGFLSDISGFDPLFFEISPSEAATIDPQQRLLMEEIWKALEYAGYGTDIQGEKVGIFVGAEDSDYKRLLSGKEYVTSNNTSLLSARIAYQLNLKGPNLTLNTACSSGLTAFHQAMLSLKNGECDSAIVAGVSLSCTSFGFDAMDRAGMVSSERHLRAFDRKASGMVPAEAVAVVILKKEEKARQDGHQIYGYVLGSGINYDGKTIGITAPNEDAQRNLILSIYNKYGIDAEKLGLIMAHGTGTKLGDPMEFNALSAAIGEKTDKKNFCCLASSKSNLGHSLAASGIVSLIALLMAMKNKSLPPQCNFESPNEFINPDDSPFFFNDSLKPWENEDGYPLLGAVSALGMSGTNAHVVIEQGEGPVLSHNSKALYLFVLSARSAEALNEKCKDLSAFLKNASEDVLYDTSFTLIDGRIHFRNRLAFVAKDKAEAIKYLDNPESCIKGTPGKGEKLPKEEMQHLNQLEESLDELSGEKAYKDALLELAHGYCEGFELNGKELLPSAKRIVLPAYPFENMGCWADNAGKSADHYVLENKSDFEAVRFETVISSQAFFLREHVICGEKILPGVMILEIVHRAAIKAFRPDEKHIVRLSNIGWVSPISCVNDEDIRIRIDFIRNENQEIVFSVHLPMQEPSLVRCRGIAEIIEKPFFKGTNVEDLHRNALSEIAGRECYALFANRKMDYGTAFRCIDKLYLLNNGVLASLKRPAGYQGEFAIFPGIADGALQSTIGFAFREGFKAKVPFAMDSLEIYSDSSEKMWAIARKLEGKLDKYDVELFGDDGSLCARMMGFASREINRLSSLPQGKVLKRTLLASIVQKGEAKAGDIVNICINMSGAPQDVQVLNCHENEPIDTFINIAKITQNMVKSDYKSERFIQVVIPSDGPGSMLGGIEGLFRSAELENPEFFGKVIEMPRDAASAEITDVLENEYFDKESHHVIYKNKVRYVEGFAPVTLKKAGPNIWKDGGVYLITGGNGGLGRIFALEIAKNTKNATILLTGRRPEDDRVRELAGLIKDTENNAYYSSLDVSDKEAVKDFVKQNISKYGRLNGILHCAGINRDKYLILKKEDEIESVLSPKIRGVLNLDDATSDTDLDFFICFSSITGAIGNAGQADYAIANAFMDRFVICRDKLVRENKRKGASLSINWPLWKDGGMHVSADDEKMLKDVFGSVPMPTQDGIDMFYGIWEKRQTQALVEAACLFGQGDAFDNLVEKLTASKEVSGDLAVTLFVAPDRSYIQTVDRELGLASINTTAVWLLPVEEKSTGCDREFFADYDDDYENVISDITNKSGSIGAVFYLSPLADRVFLMDTTGIKNLLSALGSALDENVPLFIAAPYENESNKAKALECLNEFSRLPQVSIVECNLSENTPEDFIQLMLEYCPKESKVTVKPVTVVAPEPVVKEKETEEEVSGDVLTKTINLLVKSVSKLLGLPEDKIDLDSPMDEYGLNSMVILDLISDLEKTFGSLPKTLFYEYDNLREMGGFLSGKFPKEKINIVKETKTSVQSTIVFEDTKKEEIKNKEPKPSSDIAIIGLSGVYPGSDTLSDFWENLKAGADLIETVPYERWDTDFYQKKIGDKTTMSAYGGFISNPDMFDPLFFHISPREAQVTDPQEGLMLMNAYHAMEDAGYTKAQLEKIGNVGVIIGVMYSDYQFYGVEEQAKGNMEALTGSYASVANRISYILNIHGPSMAVDSMCSSSLSSLYFACKEIETGRCEMMIAGGVNLSLHPDKYVLLAKQHFSASNGRCMSFGEGGDGYVPAEGCGAVILKSLDKAVADGDHIYGVIRAIEANHGGRTSGYTVPNPKAQADAMLRSFEKSGISPETINYIEAHGTGTSLGDPIEVTSLTNAFRKYTDKKGICALGSVKSNMGHAEAAAGMAALTKVLLQIKHRQLVPSIHSEKLNPFIDFESSPFVVNRQLKEWTNVTVTENGTDKKIPLRAGIESFGAGGSNVYMIVEEHVGTSKSFDGPFTFVFSAHTEKGVLKLLEDLCDRLERGEYTDADLPAMAWTLQTGRQPMEVRLGYSVNTISELKEKLHKYLYSGEPLESEKGDRNIELFVQGENVDWAKSFGDKHPDRISMPLYPYDKERCWYKDNRKNIEFLTEEWTAAEAAPEKNISYEDVLWLLDDEKKADEIKKLFSGKCNIAICGNGKSSSSVNSYIDISDSTAAIEGLRGFLSNGMKEPSYVISFLMDGSSAEPSNIAKNGYIFKALIANKIKPSSIILVGRWHDDVSFACVDAMYGYVQSSRSLFTKTKVSLIEGRADELSLEMICKRCVMTISGGLTGMQRFIEGSFKTCILTKKEFKNNKNTFTRNGVYIITGGMGGLGTMLAVHLLKKYHACVALLGRGLNAAKEEKLNTLKAHYPGRVIFVQADVCDKKSMKLAVDTVKNTFGRINGLFHAAGIEGVKKLTESDDKTYESIIAPKVTGTLAIFEVLQNENVELMCFFSSTSALYGDFGDCAYSTGNRFMMDIAGSYNFENCKVLSINWPLWRNGGMGSDDRDAVNMYLKAAGLRYLENKEGLEALDTILLQNEKQVAVIAKADKENINVEDKKSVSEPLAVPKETVPEKASSSDARSRLIDMLIKDISTLMKIDEDRIGTDVLLADYGFDSITLQEFAVLLNKQTKVEVVPDTFYSYPTVLKLTEYLAGSAELSFAEEVPVSSKANEISLEDDKVSKEITVTADEPIAIIGMSGLFPGADDPDKLYDILMESKITIDDMPVDRPLWNDGVVRKAGSINNIYNFDPLFFEIPPSEAEAMDPRQRLLLQECYKALENAGIGQSLIGSEEMGIFVGAEDNSYGLLTDFAGGITSNHNAMLAARLAYYLDMKGPNMTINTACSSGLSAVHEACLSIRSGECDSAIAAGVNIMLLPKTYDYLEEAGMLSKTRTLYAFDNRADGMVPSEGVACVVLKRLSLARRDNHKILGIIKGSGINYDGRTNGITAPGIPSQEKLYTSVYRHFGINPSDIGYVLAHGTGTKLGDPMEMKALTQAFSHFTDKKKFCALGSIKANIGHGLAVSGVSNMIAMVEAFGHGTIYPQVNYSQGNEAVNWDESPFYVTTATKSWDENEEGKRLGAISSFGMSGTNVHVVMENDSDAGTYQDEPFDKPVIIPISARSEKALEIMKNNLADTLEKGEVRLCDVSYTLIEGRRHFQYRICVIADSLKEAIEDLRSSESNKVDRKFFKDNEVINTIERLSKEYAGGNDKASLVEILKKIGMRYLEGYVPDGSLLFENTNVCRIPLPTYAFDEERYLIPVKEKTLSCASSGGTQMKLSLKEEILNNPVETDASEMDVLETLRGIFSELLKIPPQMLEDDAPLDEYGIDSILNIKIIEKIEAAFGPQRKTLLFEYNTIESLSQNLTKSEKKVNSPVVKDVKKASSEEEVLGDFRENDIAIIGLAGRYPGSRKVDEYWKNLALGKDLITPIPKDRWDNKQYFSRFDESEMPYLKEAGFMDGVYEFDPMFFAIAPNEARDIEPQERLFLECCYEAMEDAGYTRDSLSKEVVGVFAGAMNGDYNSYCAQEQVLGNPSTILGHSSSVANRVSYFMNLSGPSFTVDTMCSSSLTALHLACKSLVSGECKAAFVGGVNLNIHPIKFHRLCKGKFMSSHARCMAFGKDADGYVPSEGVGAILIKPLKDAVSDGDHIYAVVKGTAINHGGKTSGYTVPSPEAQSKVIKEALLNAQIEPDRVTYIEAHGTGTKLGDPIEITGLERVYKEKVSKLKSCAIGSVKSNIGHTEGAAGIAGLTKILLQMREGKIAPSLHSSELNPYIDFENSPFFVPQKLMDWERISADGNGKVYPRCAGISSFGAGGSNSHVIIEEYIGKSSAAKSLGTPMAVPVSARTKEQLESKVAELYSAVKKLSEEEFLSVVYTLQTGREFFDYRIGFMASDMQELREKLLACKEKKEAEAIYINHVVRSPETVKELSALKEEAGKFLKEGNQNELLKLWAKGADVSFDKLYEGTSVQKISLPTYPFDRTVYCSIDRMKKLLFPEGNEKADEEPYELMTFEERLVPAPVSDSDITEKEHRILCFAQGADLRQSAIEEAGICSGKIDIVWVQAGEQYNRFSATDYAINYDHEEDFEKCLLSVMEEDKKVDEILYLIPMEDNLYFRNHAPLIYLLKSLFAAGLGKTKLFIAGAADDELNLAYAKALVGMERSVGVSELSANIAVILTDSINTDQRAFLGTMFKECLLGTTESVIYENGERKIYRVKPFEIEKSNKGRIRKNGTYLITGGMGGLGLIFARHLGQKYKANLILTGRKSESDIQDKLAALKDEGVNAVYVSADVCNEEQIKKAVETAKTKFGALNGVIHAAGLPEGKPITQKDESEFSRITRPKMQGTLLLEKALENVDIDFICYFSSISAVLGDFGSFDYAVGNRFLVSYAEHRRAAKGSLGETFVIEWPFWHDGGMGFATEAAERMYMRTSGQKGLTGQVGTVLFDLLIDSGKDCSFAMYGIPERVSKTLGIGINELKKVNLNEVDTEPEKKAAAACEVSTASDVKEAITVSANTSKEILDKLHGLVCKILGVGMNDIDDNLFLADFGFDSISLSQFAKDITTILNVKVTPDVFYRYTTLNELTGFISEHVKATEVKAAEPSDKTQQKDAYVAPLSQDGIVIVGISGKFPDADNVDELWDILVNGVEAIHGAPKRKGWENFKDPDGNVRLGALKTIDEFDPAFFEISPREACFMDPRQRLLLEETYGAMLDAGISQKEIDEGRIGMFIGAEEGDYGILSSGGSVTANHNGVLAARLSYFLNLHGPNMCINTACSSGLVAFHQACQSLRTGECDIAIAAGVNLMCTPVLYDGMKKAGMLSESGSCYTFDKRADGMVPSEAVAALVLKRRQAAIRDKDHIYAEVLGSEINYDGRTNGITAPSGKAQAKLLEDTYKRFGIDPSGLNYYVAHGTGTRIGDPIELNSAFEAFSKAGVKKNSCIITSTKPNIGHSLAASGLVSLISLLLAMKNEVIPGEINLDEPSDYVDWEESPFVINRKNRPFKDGDHRRIGAVSAFGMSGTNAHVVVGSVKNIKTAQISQTKWLLVFSAKTEKALKELIKASIEDFKKNKKEEDLPGICYTLLNGRVHYDHRLAFAAGSLADAISKLEKALLGDSDKSIFMDCVEKGFVPKEKTLQISKLLIKQVCDGSEPDKLQGALNMLAQMYSKGIAPDGLYDNLDVIKVTLSPYPFEKKSYWVPETEPEKTEEVKPAVKEDKKDTPKTEVVKRNMNNTENLLIETVLKDLSESLAKELFMEEDEISYDRSFLEMGLDSIVGVEWMRHINKTYGLDIESTRIYEYPTLMELANYIISIKNKPEKETTEDRTTVEEQPKDDEQAVGVLRSLSDAAAFEFNEENKSVGTISLKPLTDAAVNTTEAISQDAQEKPAPSASEVPEVDVEEIMKDLAESLAKELFMEPGEVDYDQGFMELGLDSIVGVEWIRYINKKYNLNMESTRLYEYPTIIKLASYIVSLSSGGGGKAPVKEAPKKEEAKTSSKDDIDSIMDKIYSGDIDENAMDLF